MKKLDQSKVEYIVAEKRKGSKNATMAEAMGISVRVRVQVYRAVGIVGMVRQVPLGVRSNHA